MGVSQEGFGNGRNSVGERGEEDGGEREGVMFNEERGRWGVSLRFVFFGKEWVRIMIKKQDLRFKRKILSSYLIR